MDNRSLHIIRNLLTVYEKNQGEREGPGREKEGVGQNDLLVIVIDL